MNTWLIEQLAAAHTNQMLRSANTPRSIATTNRSLPRHDVEASAVAPRTARSWMAATGGLLIRTGIRLGGSGRSDVGGLGGPTHVVC